MKGKGSLSWSCGLIWGVAEGGKLAEPDYLAWVDVRDVARAHVRVLEMGESGRKRIILTRGSMWYNDVS
jgi:nucleoside-diphosphate-sugar epimerase